jgi:hypothetical protein
MLTEGRKKVQVLEREKVVRHLVSYREIINSRKTLSHNETVTKKNITTPEKVKLELGLECYQALELIS